MNAEAFWLVGVSITNGLNHFLGDSGWTNQLLLLACGGADAYWALKQRYWLAHGFVHIDKCLLQALLELQVSGIELFLSDVASTD